MNPAVSVPLIPTIPGSRDLKGIITDSHSFSSLKSPSGPTGTSKVLFAVIIALLIAAIGLLAVVLLKAT